MSYPSDLIDIEWSQIEGGIQCYTEEFPKGYFRGKNYVFDNRITVRINNDVLSTCNLCYASCDDYNNCLNAACNKHHISCAAFRETYKNTCSKECMKLLDQGLVKKCPPLDKATVDSCAVQ